MFFYKKNQEYKSRKNLGNGVKESKIAEYPSLKKGLVNVTLFCMFMERLAS